VRACGRTARQLARYIDKTELTQAGCGEGMLSGSMSVNAWLRQLFASQGYTATHASLHLGTCTVPHLLRSGGESLRNQRLRWTPPAKS
jgi:hypothetical protein